MNNGKICISVCAETADEMIAKIKRAELLGDVIEVRFDCLLREELERLLLPRTYPGPANVIVESTTTPIISTFRPKEQGGCRYLSMSERYDFWRSGHETEYCDIEDEEILDDSWAWVWETRISSFHDFDGTTDNIEVIFNRFLEINAQAAKIGVKAKDIIDCIPVWQLIDRAKAEKLRFTSIAMGEAGKWTRILGLAHGAYMTYASLDEGEETADGQVMAKDLIEVYRVKELDKNTLVYGVIGDPVSSSLSPYMHNAAFVFEKMNAVFLPLLVKNLGEFIRRMVAGATREVELNFAGFSVTMPHKRTITKYLDEIDAVAEKIGAVNTVKISDGKLIGYNTDAPGFITPLKTKFGDLKNAHVAVIGAGGAARACVHALTQEGADVTVLSRDLKKAETLTDEFSVKVEQLTTDHQPLNNDIVVNATPLGMKGEFENESPLTAEQLDGVKLVYDLVTKAEDTPLIHEARKVGAEPVSGVEMLIAQGLRQFEIWTEREAPAELMRQSVLKRLAK